MDQSRILVTGATGFVGSRFCQRLREQRPNAGLLGISNRGGNLAPWPILAADVRSHAFVEAVESFRPTHVVHLAARSSVQEGEGDALGVADSSIAGAMALSDAVRLHAPDARVLFASSAEVYGGAFLADRPLNEEDGVLPRGAYARAKLAAELILTDRLGHRSSLVIMRPTNHTAGGQDARFVIPSLARQISVAEMDNAGSAILVGNLDAERDFMSVDDVVSAYLLALEPENGSGGVEIYNVSSGQTTSIRSILDWLLANAARPIAVASDPARLRKSDIPRARVDSRKLRRELGWATRTDWKAVALDVLEHERRAMPRR